MQQNERRFQYQLKVINNIFSKPYKLGFGSMKIFEY